jgi:hypothetical protein
LPAKAKPLEIAALVVVLPTPPFPEVTTIIFATNQLLPTPLTEASRK